MYSSTCSRFSVGHLKPMLCAEEVAEKGKRANALLPSCPHDNDTLGRDAPCRHVRRGTYHDMVCRGAAAAAAAAAEADGGVPHRSSGSRATRSLPLTIKGDGGTVGRRLFGKASRASALCHGPLIILCCRDRQSLGSTCHNLSRPVLYPGSPSLPLSLPPFPPTNPPGRPAAVFPSGPPDRKERARDSRSPTPSARAPRNESLAALLALQDRRVIRMISQLASRARAHVRRHGGRMPQRACVSMYDVCVCVLM